MEDFDQQEKIRRKNAGILSLIAAIMIAVIMIICFSHLHII
jgi:hypothetical protein